MEIYYIILGIVFVITFVGWWVFESGAVFDAMDAIEKDKLDRSKK